MKGLYYFNFICFVVVIILYFIDPILGGLAMLIPMAIIQVLSSLVLLTKRNEMSSNSQKLLSIYFLTIFGGFLLGVLASFLPNSLKDYAKYLGFLPFLLSIYFMIITYLIYKDLHNV